MHQIAVLQVAARNRVGVARHVVPTAERAIARRDAEAICLQHRVANVVVHQALLPATVTMS